LYGVISALPIDEKKPHPVGLLFSMLGAVAVEQALETRMDTAFTTYHVAIMPPNMPPKKIP
jgi:hypothetical protein